MCVLSGSLNLRSNAHNLGILLTWTLGETEMGFNFLIIFKSNTKNFPIEGRTWLSNFENGERKGETQFRFGDSGSNPMAMVVQTWMEIE